MKRLGRWFKRAWRKRRAVPLLLEALDLWSHVFGAMLELSETDSTVKTFRDKVDEAWRILKYGKSAGSPG
jgi:hypothetical protein